MTLSAAGSMNPDSGVEVVRAALKSHSKASLNIATTAKDLQVSTEDLEGFIDRRVALRPDTLHGLVKLLFHSHAELDLERDVLRPAMREPAKVIGVARPASPAMTSLPLRPAGLPPKPFPLPGAAQPPLRKPGWA